MSKNPLIVHVGADVCRQYDRALGFAEIARRGGSYGEEGD
jgi:hypothetical protein